MFNILISTLFVASVGPAFAQDTSPFTLPAHDIDLAIKTFEWAEQISFFPFTPLGERSQMAFDQLKRHNAKEASGSAAKDVSFEKSRPNFGIFVGSTLDQRPNVPVELNQADIALLTSLHRLQVQTVFSGMAYDLEKIGLMKDVQLDSTSDHFVDVEIVPLAKRNEIVQPWLDLFTKATNSAERCKVLKWNYFRYQYLVTLASPKFRIKRVSDIIIQTPMNNWTPELREDFERINSLVAPSETLLKIVNSNPELVGKCELETGDLVADRLDLRIRYSIGKLDEDVRVPFGAALFMCARSMAAHYWDHLYFLDLVDAPPAWNQGGEAFETFLSMSAL